MVGAAAETVRAAALGRQESQQGGLGKGAAEALEDHISEAQYAGEIKLGPAPAGWRGGGQHCGLPREQH